MPTLDALITRVRVDRAFNSTTVISDADLTTLLVEGALDMALRGHALILSATWSAVANTGTYVLSGDTPKVSNFLEVFHEMAGGLIYTQSSGKTKSSPNDFQWTSEGRLDLDYPGWQDATASDTLKAVYLTHDSSGNLVLGVYPKSLTATPTFKLYFLSRGTDMTAGKYPWTGSAVNMTHTEPYQKGIAFYTLWHLHETYTLIGEQAQKYRDLYVVTAEEMKEAQDRAFFLELAGDRDYARVLASQTFGGR